MDFSSGSGWAEIGLLLCAAAFMICAMLPRLRSWRSVFWGACALMLLSAISPRLPLGQFFVNPDRSLRVPSELFGIAWWILGAWLVKSLLDLILRRTIFPEDNEPHARRLFADLASALIYVLAFVGIMDTVFKQSFSGVLATSGVVAIILGLALQSTLADLFSGLALNIERSFMSGDWIATSDGVEGLVIEINWRATRIKTWSNDMIVIPNSVIAKAVVKNHSRLKEPYICTIRVSVDHAVAPQRVIDTLQAAARHSSAIASGTSPSAYACRFDDALIVYELAFTVDNFTVSSNVQSEVIRRVAESFQDMGIVVGTPAMDVRLIHGGYAAAAPTMAQPSNLRSTSPPKPNRS